ncbi:Cof-type HAD-IIB family hydrolase [Sphingomonas bacterium]|uniref:Cof-type HAD-IIB family hydrolase n=1 Tax=Sphingomonas bacterium TaxID=1895847 RepID=UPI0015756A8A|nr:Cof-type HAD-IIB family hydrolase [Sphingomonas bacterium]
MNPIKLVVSDVDGTLVDKEKRLAPATADAVARLRGAGCAFTIISARPVSGMRPLADTLAIDHPMGAFNGGIVWTRAGGVSEHHVVDPAVARGVFECVGDLAVDRWVFADDRWYSSTDRGVHVEHERVASNSREEVRADFGEFLDRADKITFVSDTPAVLAELHARIDARFAGQATVGQSQTYYLDITALEANKGAGIVALAAAIGVGLDATAAIGDQNNDLPMLGLAGYSVGMGNAPANVQAAADAVTAANDADGVAHAIDAFILPRIGVPT